MDRSFRKELHYRFKISSVHTKMPTQKRKSPQKVTRSARLRKYEAAYNSTKVAGKPRASPPRRSPPRKPRPKKTQASPQTKKKRSPPVRASPKKSPRKAPVKKAPVKKSPAKKPSKTRKRPLNAYQRFVREESSKEKYNGLLATERMRQISKAWQTRS